MEKEYKIMSPETARKIHENNLKNMKFKVIHEDYWPVPETVQNNLTTNQARELLSSLQNDNPENEYFICESKDDKYIPLEGNWCHPSNKNTN